MIHELEDKLQKLEEKLTLKWYMN